MAHLPRLLFIFISFAYISCRASTCDLENLSHHISLPQKAKEAFAASVRNLGFTPSIVDNAYGKGVLEFIGPKSEGSFAFIDTYYEYGVLTLSNIYVSPSKRDKGVSRALLGVELTKHPGTEVIYSECMVHDNKVEVEKFLNQGYSVENAIKQTAAYKIMAWFGFSELIPGSVKRKTYGFSVRRP